MRTKGGQGGDEEERRLQREVLALALVEHPRRLSLREIVGVLGRPPAVERAVAALVGDGLLVLDGEEIAPTSAAIRFNQIEPIEPPSQA